MSWNPDVYLHFQKEREQPGLDLLAAITPDLAPENIADLGCGAGNLALHLQQKFPQASLLLVDSSDGMLEKCRQLLPHAATEKADLNIWTPPGGLGLIFSNATVHWLEKPVEVIRRWLACLKPGGQLVVQVPDNFEAPAFELVVKLVNQLSEAPALLPHLPRPPLPPPEDWLFWLQNHSTGARVWRTTYYHLLAGENEVLKWLEGTTLTSLKSHFSAEDWEAFRNTLGEELKKTFPCDAENRVVFPFRRYFFVARV